MATEQRGHPAPEGTVRTGPLEATCASSIPTVEPFWLEEEGRPHVVRIDLPLSTEEMVAALYGDRERLTPVDLGSDEDVWGQIALVVIQDGLTVVDQRAALIDAQESHRTLTAPEWLTLCRRRVDEVTEGTAGNPLNARAAQA